MAVRKNKEGKWIVDFRYPVPGSRKMKRLTRVSPIQTKRAALRLERKLMEQAECAPASFGRQRRFEDYAEHFMAGYAAGNNKPSEQETKAIVLRVHLNPAFGRLWLEEITTFKVERYKATKKDANLSPKTINNHLTILSTILKEAQHEGVLHELPKIRRLKVRKPNPVFLGFDEAKQLVDAADPKWRPMIVTGLNTGLRLGELLALRWSDVDLQKRALVVEQAVAVGVVGTPKDEDARPVPLNDTVWSELTKLRENSTGELVFPDADGGIMQRHRPVYPLHTACRHAGIRKVGWHSLRHTFATLLVDRNAPLPVVQELLGHSELKTTMIYSHVLQDAKKKCVRLLDSPPGKNKESQKSGRKKKKKSK